MNNRLVTTNLVPLTIGSTETFVFDPTLDGLPWNLAGGAASLLMTDPNGTQYTYPATVGTDGVARCGWTVIGPGGTWLRAWRANDATGLVQYSLPIIFEVVSSPS